VKRAKVPDQRVPAQLPAAWQVQVPGCPGPLPTVERGDADQLARAWGGTVTPAGQDEPMVPS
jgi:hypothetical protein